MPRTNRHLKIRLNATTPDYARSPRLPLIPPDPVTPLIARLHAHRPPRERVAGNITQVEPHTPIIHAIREHSLTHIGREDAVLDGGQLDSDAPGLGVAVQRLAVGLVASKGDLRADVAADGPEVEGCVALIGYDCAAEGLDGGD